MHLEFRLCLKFTPISAESQREAPGVAGLICVTHVIRALRRLELCEPISSAGHANQRSVKVLSERVIRAHVVGVGSETK